MFTIIAVVLGLMVGGAILLALVALTYFTYRLTRVFSGENKALLLALPKLVEGLIAMAQAQAGSLDKLSEGIAILRESLFAPDKNDYSGMADSTPAARKANEEYQISNMVKNGISEAEARTRMKDGNLYRDMASKYSTD